jgi:hypothetical protein
VASGGCAARHSTSMVTHRCDMANNVTKHAVYSTTVLFNGFDWLFYDVLVEVVLLPVPLPIDVPQTRLENSVLSWSKPPYAACFP